METLGSIVVVKSRTTCITRWLCSSATCPEIRAGGACRYRAGLQNPWCQSNQSAAGLPPTQQGCRGWQRRSPFGSGPGLSQGLEEREARGLQDSRPGTSWLATWLLTCPAGACKLRHLNGLSLVQPRGEETGHVSGLQRGLPHGPEQFRHPQNSPPRLATPKKFEPQSWESMNDYLSPHGVLRETLQVFAPLPKKTLSGTTQPASPALGGREKSVWESASPSARASG